MPVMKTFTNDAMKPLEMTDHFERVYCDKKTKILNILNL